jgi:transcription elongation factor GreA
MGKSVVMTREGYNKLVDDFQRMRGDDMREALQNLTDAREKGDISENAEYEVAKQALDELHKKIKKTGETLNKVRIIESVLDDGTVQLLTWAKIKNLKTGKDVEYKIVPENESSIKENKISSESPIGKSLMGKKVGEKVEVNVPAGKLEFELLNIRCH